MIEEGRVMGKPSRGCHYSRHRMWVKKDEENPRLGAGAGQPVHRPAGDEVGGGQELGAEAPLPGWARGNRGMGAVGDILWGMVGPSLHL